MAFIEWLFVPVQVVLIAAHAALAMVEIPVVELESKIVSDPVEIEHKIDGEVDLKVDLGLEN